MTRATRLSACAGPQPRQKAVNKNRKIRIVPIAAPNRNVIRVVADCHRGKMFCVTNITGARARMGQGPPASHNGGWSNVYAAESDLLPLLPGLPARSAAHEPSRLDHRNLVIPGQGCLATDSDNPVAVRYRRCAVAEPRGRASDQLRATGDTMQQPGGHEQNADRAEAGRARPRTSAAAPVRRRSRSRRRLTASRSAQHAGSRPQIAASSGFSHQARAVLQRARCRAILRRRATLVIRPRRWRSCSPPACNVSAWNSSDLSGRLGEHRQDTVGDVDRDHLRRTQAFGLEHGGCLRCGVDGLSKRLDILITGLCHEFVRPSRAPPAAIP